MKTYYTVAELAPDYSTANSEDLGRMCNILGSIVHSEKDDAFLYSLVHNTYLRLPKSVVRSLEMRALSHKFDKLILKILQPLNVKNMGPDFVFYTLNKYEQHMKDNLPPDFKKAVDYFDITTPDNINDPPYWVLNKFDLGALKTLTIEITPKDVLIRADSELITNMHTLEKQNALFAAYPFLNPSHPDFSNKLDAALKAKNALDIDNYLKGKGGYHNRSKTWFSKQDHEFTPNMVETIASVITPTPNEALITITVK